MAKVIFELRISLIHSSAWYTSSYFQGNRSWPQMWVTHAKHMSLLANYEEYLSKQWKWNGEESVLNQGWGLVCSPSFAGFFFLHWGINSGFYEERSLPHLLTSRCFLSVESARLPDKRSLERRAGEFFPLQWGQRNHHRYLYLFLSLSSGHVKYISCFLNYPFWWCPYLIPEGEEMVLKLILYSWIYFLITNLLRTMCSFLYKREPLKKLAFFPSDPTAWYLHWISSH